MKRRPPKNIRYRGGRYLRTAEDIEDIVEEEAESEPKPGEFSFKDYQLGEGASAMARMLVAGLAAKLVADGVTKEQIKKAKINEASANFNTWLKAVLAERGAFKEELRLLQRYGPQQYLHKKAQQLKGASK